MNAGDLTIRNLVGDDSTELSELIRRVHGPHYFQRDVYDPVALARTIESGLRMGIVAGSPEGRLHGSVVFQRHSPREATGFFNLFMVDREHQGRGLGAVMLRELIGLCHAKEMRAAYADAVMSDDASQVAAAREGATETAIQFAATFRSLERHARSELDRPCRPTLWWLFRFHGADGVLPVYAPSRYAEIVQRIYDAAGVRRRVETAGEGTMAAQTEFRSALERDYATGTIRVSTIGADFHPAIDAAATELEAAGCVVVELDLPLRDPATAVVGAELVDLGFGLGGVIPQPPPSSGQPDVLRFQRVGDVPTQTDTNVTISPLGRALLRIVLDDLAEAREAAARRRRTLWRCATGRQGNEGSGVHAVRRWERVFGIPTCRTLKPLLVSQTDVDRDARVAERVGTAICDAAARALRDEELRALIWGRSPPLDEVTPPLYYRIDATPSPTGLKIFEYNGGAPTGFHTQDLVNALALAASPTDSRPGRPLPLVSALVEAVEDTHRDRLGDGRPSVVIALSPELVNRDPQVPRSQQAFGALLRAAGWKTYVRALATLRYDGHALRDRSDGAAIDIVIRHYLPGDPDAVAIDAAHRAGAVALVNPPSPLDAKALLELVDDRAVPWTRVLVNRTTVGPGGSEIDLLDFARAARERLVLKPSRSYGGRGVMLGEQTDPAEWSLALDRALAMYEVGRRFVLQERIAQARGTFLEVSDKPRRLAMFYDRNAVVFGGRFAGYTTRVSRSPITNLGRGGGMAPILLQT